MNSKTILSLAILAISSVAMATTVESTNHLFTVSSGNIDVAHNSPSVKNDFYVPTGVSNVRITGTIRPTCNATAPVTNDLVTVRNKFPQAALVAYTNAWYGWHCTVDDGSNGAWELITGSAATENSDNSVTVEFKSGSVKYTVPGPASTTKTLELENPCIFTSITNLAFSGYGSYDAFDGLSFETLEITVDASSASEAVKTAIYAIIGADTAKPTVEQLNAKGDNGLTKWETIVLGLENASTPVYTAPVQSSDPNLLGFKLGNVDTTKYTTALDGSYSVTYSIEKCNADGSSSEPTIMYSDENKTPAGTPEGNATVYVDVPTSGVQYYKIKIKISNP